MCFFLIHLAPVPPRRHHLSLTRAPKYLIVDIDQALQPMTLLCHRDVKIALTPKVAVSICYLFDFLI
jgi:hypothetical protein